MALGDSDQVHIRLARAEDAARVAELSEQLGYPAEPQDVQWRLESIQQHQDQAVFVATLENGYVVGWIHLFVYRLVTADPQASIGGVVVDEDYRDQGIGRRLLQLAEQWAQERGCWAVYVRSKVTRERAHGFYERHGYKRVKTQLALRKDL